MRWIGLLLLCLTMAGGAGAQPLRTVVIGPEAGVAVPPRGEPMPAARPLAMPTSPMPLTPLPPLGSANGGGLGAVGLGAVGLGPAAVLIPLAAATLLGSGGVPGSGSSAPARTR